MLRVAPAAGVLTNEASAYDGVMSSADDDGGRARSWVQASVEAQGRPVEPGIVKIFARPQRMQSALRRGPWFARGTPIALRTTLSLIVLANFIFAHVCMYLYCGTSIFYVVSMIGTMIYYWVGKPYVLMHIRQTKSPAFVPMALCTSTMLAPIQSLEMMQVGGVGVFVLTQVSQVIPIFGAVACFLYGGWTMLPAWALISIGAVPAFFIDAVALGNPMLVTDLFLRSAEALITCLKQLEVFSYARSSRGVTVDWAATYKNYDALCGVVESFSTAWRTFFFVVEFVCVPAIGLNLIAFVSSVNNLRIAVLASMAGLPPKTPILFCVASVLTNVGFTIAFLALVVGLWVRAARLTDACNIPRRLGLDAIAASSSLAKSEDADCECERARRFVAYCEHRAPGFSCHGVAISFHLGMLLVYPLVTFCVTLAFPLAMTFLGGFV